MDFITVQGTSMWDLDTPSLLLDLEQLEQNIETLHSFYRTRVAKVRSVTKGHRCPAIAQMQMTTDGAVQYGLSCAKVSEAEVMAEAGARHIRMVGEVVGALKVQRLMELARNCDVLALVDDPRNVDEIGGAAEAFGVSLGVLIEVDIGEHRSGVQPGRPSLELARHIMRHPRLQFRGLGAHEGTLRYAGREERFLKARERLQLLVDCREIVEKAGIPVEICGAGSTSSWDVAGDVDGITEISPGSYALYGKEHEETIPDLGFETAVKVLATVTSRPAKDRAITDCGSRCIPMDRGDPVVEYPEGATSIRLDPEHGILHLEGDAKQLRPGDKVVLAPRYHGSMVNTQEYFVGIRNGKVECVWEIAARGSFR